VRRNQPARKLSIVADENKRFPWGPGTATGIGSLPGTDPLEAARAVIAELPDFPHLAELPARGPGADMIGRTAALLIDIPIETTPRGWRLSPERPGKDFRRAKSLLSSDLDAMEETLDGFDGLLKVALAGPWTLAAALEQPHSLNPALADPGAVADLAASLAEGAAAHVAEVTKRVPGAAVVVQVDEPALPAVIEGSVPTPSGLSRVRAVDEEILRDRLHAVLAAVPAYTVVHCCRDAVPFTMIAGSGADGVSFDLSLVRRGDWDQLAEVAEAALGLLVGAIPAVGHAQRALPAGDPGGRPPGRPAPASGGRASAVPGPGHPGTGSPVSSSKHVARLVADAWRRMGLPPGACAPQVVITPACGLAGASPAGALAVLKRAREAARILPELMEERS
jgi:methionine synthase II (cobalamin-independent)